MASNSLPITQPGIAMTGDGNELIVQVISLRLPSECPLARLHLFEEGMVSEIKLQGCQRHVPLR